MDDDRTRSLEQEAIALVSLSTATHFATSDPPHEALTEASAELLDGAISMKSLLVTLKKKRPLQPEIKREDGPDAGSTPETDVDSAKLPSFRTVFQPPREPPLPKQALAPDSVFVESVMAAELKCKYRTGKCRNVRALKSCGDHHNLCNYHRLRANANQRKLDRKKKEQRLLQQQQQQQQRTATVAASASSPRAVKHRVSVSPSPHAAAAALASLVAARHHFYSVVAVDVTAVQEAAGKTSMDRSTTGTTSRVRPKQEDACSY
ncbi:unnamed protein product [Hyaloperonospora brassicae]|uniref:SCA7 domain-containing protein n=1 Tax=Hyaloperonospora brassicae TaxID=162125 RepID=A0AAV0UE40_HYABA|nr:unnamed protein product [Hyaloperonospora brassicae]